MGNVTNLMVHSRISCWCTQIVNSHGELVRLVIIRKIEPSFLLLDLHVCKKEMSPWGFIVVECLQVLGGVWYVGGVKIGNRLRPHRASPFMGTFPGTFFISPHPSSTYPIAPGNIEVFKGMKLTTLNLEKCSRLTGMFGLASWVGYGRWGQDWKQAEGLRPQAIAQRTFLGTLLHFFSPFLCLPHSPRRYRGVQGHGTHQLELVELPEAHRCVWSWVGFGRWGQDWKQAEAPGHHP
jgi:hypothetical protein